MTTQTITNMKPETVSGLQELIQALHDSVDYLRDAAEKVDDNQVSRMFREIANDRAVIGNEISALIDMSPGDEEPAESGTWLGSLRRKWTSFRAALNAGDPTVVLIEAERAEDMIVHRFKDILPEIAGNPVNDRLVAYFAKIRSGHDRVLEMRNSYQNS